MKRILGLSVLSDVGLGWKVGAIIAVSLALIGVLAYLEFGDWGKAAGKHRRPDGDPIVHDDDDTGDGDGDDDDWAYELHDMNRDRLVTAVTTSLAPVTETFMGQPLRDRPYERIVTADDADTFLTSVHRRDTIIDPYADDWFDQSMNELLAWADRQDSERFADLMEAAKVARDWEEAIAA